MRPTHVGLVSVAVAALSALTWTVMLAVEWRALVAPNGYVLKLIGLIAVPSAWLVAASWLALRASPRTRYGVFGIVLYVACLNGLAFSEWLLVRGVMPAQWSGLFDRDLNAWLAHSLLPWTFWPVVALATTLTTVGWWQRRRDRLADPDSDA